MTELSREELYEIPIERLGLPVKTLNIILRTGMMSVGDCVDAVEAHLYRDWMYSGRWDAFLAIRDEILPALIEQGYWTAPLNPRAFAPEIIEELKRKLAENRYLPEN